MIFILLCSTAGYVAQWFIFQSTEAMIVELHVARGTAGVSAQNVQAARYVPYYFQVETLPSTIQTEANSQVVVTFSDPHTQVPIASVVLYRNSQLTITTASAPRFGLNQKPYLIQIEGVLGRAEVLVMDDAPRSAEIQLDTEFSTAQLLEPGRYMISTSGAQTDFTTLTGEALLLTSSNASLPILANQKATIDGSSPDIAVTDSETALLENPLFVEDLNIGWVTYSDADPNEPEGSIYNGDYAGRSVVVIDRAAFNFPDFRLGHGEDGIVQKISLDVSEYNSLGIRASFYVEEQSLSRCGQAASECPIMIHLTFIDEEGATQEFQQGFYAYDEPATTFPERCLTCRYPHDRISLGSWFTYESPNLVADFSDARPMTLKEIRLYASGHAYKVYISEIDIIASE